MCYSRLGRHKESLERANHLLALQPDNIVEFDILTKALYKLDRFSEASAAGTRALELKDRLVASIEKGWSFPSESPQQYAERNGKTKVISFLLWGQEPRYLRGAIHNLLLAREYFPDWHLRFYVDDSLPPEINKLLGELGGQVAIQAGGQTMRQKLCWRFQVANDPSVGHFLVRDVDSVFGVREARAVDAWLASDSWFHVIRDWWTHTDLVLAGLWGGVAGVLPSLSLMLQNYSPNAVETPNIDQWFLRDRVWGYIRQSCLVHDRYFRMLNSTQLPEPKPTGNYHIGQNEFAVRRKEQEQILQPWIDQYPCLGQVSSGKLVDWGTNGPN